MGSFVRKVIKRITGPIIRHHAYIIRQANAERIMFATAAFYDSRAVSIARSRMDNVAKSRAFGLLANRLMNDHLANRDARLQSMINIGMAMVGAQLYKEAMLLVNRKCSNAYSRKACLWEIVDKMFHSGMARNKIIDICRQVENKVPDIAEIIRDLYEKRPIY